MLVHFKREEFECKCGCGLNIMNVGTLLMLDRARGTAGVPFVINSGCRCDNHNRKIGGVKDSPHLFGFAADIKCTDSRSRWLIVESLMEAGFNRIGIGETFIHVDNMKDRKTPRLIWTYGGKK